MSKLAPSAGPYVFMSDVTIVGRLDPDCPGFIQAGWEDHNDDFQCLATAKTWAMARALAFEELARQAIMVEKAMRARMTPAEILERGL